jgi:hypothetical protein
LFRQSHQTIPGVPGPCALRCAVRTSIIYFNACSDPFRSSYPAGTLRNSRKKACGASTKEIPAALPLRYRAEPGPFCFGKKGRKPFARSAIIHSKETFDARQARATRQLAGQNFADHCLFLFVRIRSFCLGLDTPRCYATEPRILASLRCAAIPVPASRPYPPSRLRSPPDGREHPKAKSKSTHR